mgnify:FL=1
MTEIRKEVTSLLRKLRGLGYENYELVRTSKEAQCVDLDGYPFHIYGLLGENIAVKDVFDLVGRYKQMYQRNKNELYFEVGEDEGDYGEISPFIYLTTKQKISDEEYYKFLKSIYSEHLEEQDFQKLIWKAEEILGRSIAPYQIKQMIDLCKDWNAE